MSFTSPFAFTLPIYALMSARVIRQCYALSTRQRQRKTAHNDAIHYVTNGPCGQPHFCEGSQCRRLPERPGHASWGDSRRLEAEHAATPRQRSQGAVAPQVGSKEEGARLACGARRLRAEMPWLPPRQRLQGAVVPQVAPKDKGMRLGAMPAGLRGKMRCYSPLRRKRA